jgi:hypothetical protein
MINFKKLLSDIGYDNDNEIKLWYNSFEVITYE